MNEPTSLLTVVRDALAPDYEVDSELGRGGMAAVYLAADVRHDRPVAIKVLLPAIAERLGTERFLREIRITARLAHPNILPLLDSGTAGALPYYVTPYVSGDDLRALLMRRGVFPVRGAVQLVGQAARGLQHAHDGGVVHRDVKPGNILIADGVAIVADFGIARALELSGGAGLTRSGAFLGSPLYMSPEQALGATQVTGAADQYSLACVLFELLTGRAPFPGASPRHVLLQHATRPVPALRELAPEASEELGAVIRRGMSKRPEDRFPSIVEFAKAASGTQA